jgi:chromosome segregation ATPase
MSVEFSNAYQEILLDNFNSVIKQNIMFQTQLKMAEETQKNNNAESKINDLSFKYDEKINLLIAEYNALNVEYDAAKQKIADLEPRANVGQSLHDEKTRIQSALNEESRRNAVLREEIVQKSNSIEELNKKIVEQTAAIEELNKKIAVCESQFATKNKEIEELNSILEKKESVPSKVKKTNSKLNMNNVADGSSF